MHDCAADTISDFNNLHRTRKMLANSFLSHSGDNFAPDDIIIMSAAVYKYHFDDDVDF